MRRMGLIIATILLAYVLDLTFFRGKYADATFEVAVDITNQLLGREQSRPQE
jgi:hypothetical protein